MSLIIRTQYHTNPNGLDLKVNKKRIIGYVDEKGKEWILEILLRDPKVEQVEKAEKERLKNEAFKNKS